MNHTDLTGISINGAKLKSFRKSRRLTQREVSRAIGVTPATVSNYERGHGKPSGDVLARLMILYGMNPVDTIFDPAAAVTAGLGT